MGKDKLFFRWSSGVLVALLLLCVCFCVCSISYDTAYAESDGVEVYLGGYPIGIRAKSDYFVVEEFVNVITLEGGFSPALSAGVQKGDLIVTINGKAVTSAEEINNAVNSQKEVVLSVKRGKKILDIVITPVYDRASESYKIGMVVKNDLIGMGTMTFVTKDGKYGALGHAISDEFSHTAIYQTGDIFECVVTGYSVAERERPGELRGSVYFDKPIGTIKKNVFCGIYGEMREKGAGERIQIAQREEVQNGKAQILTTLHGNIPKLYDIEIIKAVSQDQPAEKSMVIRVKDKELRALTGGILQGMSGSPILQNGKLIGAVTHVFTMDSTKGYGVYIDWMLEQVK